MRFSGW